MEPSAETQSWVLSWFEGRGAVPGAVESEKLAVNYFDAGLIDSLTVVELTPLVIET